jgi:hypothetical protein
MGCATDQGADPLADWAPTTGGTTEDSIEEPLNFIERDESTSYGLPREGMASVAELVELLPADEIERTNPNIFTAAGDELVSPQCQGGGSDTLTGLPMVVEGVVTLHPRLYIKTEICGSDERFYGSFVLEDDTGGILVLRDGRVAPFKTGARIRMTVRGLAVTFGRDPDTRAVITADFEELPVATDSVLYAEQEGPFTAADVGLTRRIEGVVLQSPTNDNFSSMLIADRSLPPATDSFEAEAVCLELCSSDCNRICPSEGQQVCRRGLCPAICESTGNQYNDGGEELLPGVCWEVSLDAELVRRGTSPAIGTPMAVIGPVGNSFGRKIWVQRLGQLQTNLSDEDN